MKPDAVRTSTAATLAAVVVAACTAGGLTGCITYQDTHTWGVTTRSENRPRCVVELASRLRAVRHAQPLVGLFVGVADYDDGSGYSATPAHTISAALFREPFFLTAGGDRQHSDLRLLSSLELDAAAQAQFGSATERTLRGIAGMAQELNAVPDGRPRAEEWQYLRHAGATTRRGLLDELDRSLERAEAVAQAEGQVVFIFYVSAHGRLGADGRAYIVPSGAGRDDAATWIDQQLVQARTAAFLARSRVDGRSRKAVLVFDMCRVLRGDVPQRLAVGAPRALQDAFVVESTSPGRYAWHWTMESETHDRLEVVSETRLGFPLPPPRTKGRIVDERFAANMSIAPLASNCAISEFFAAKDRAAAPLNAADWLTGSADRLPAFAAQVPEVSETGVPQEMRLFVSSTQGPIPLLEAVPP